MQVWGLIQARMGSSRLPGKVMLPLAGHPLVWQIAQRLRSMRDLSGVVLATTEDSRNDRMVEFMKGEGATVVRSPFEDDIADRLCRALDATGANAFVKVNADCPLFDPELAQALLHRFVAANADFGTNRRRPTFPLGYSLEIVAADAIRRCNATLTSPADRELMMKWMLDHPGDFRTVSLERAEDRSDLNLCVDTPEDYRLVSGIYDALYPRRQTFGLVDVLAFLASAPQMTSANASR